MTVADTRLDSLYEANAGRVFAYCFARAGSQNVAEWAVQATFDRARAALANGGIPDPELEWLLRTADKFCAPKLCLDAQPFESMVVLQDWHGRTFDEIAHELEARYARLEEERSRLTPWRRLLGALNAAPAVSWIKGLVGSLGAVKATAAAVAVVGAIAVVGTPLAEKLHHAVRPESNAPAPSGSGSTPATRPAAAVPTTTASGGQSADAGSAIAQPRFSPWPPPIPATTGGGTGEAGGAAPLPASSQPATRPGVVSATSSATTTTAQGKPRSSAPLPTPTVPAVTAPTADLPVTTTPSVPTATLPSTETPSVPSTTLPSVDTPTAPSVETPTAPSVTTPSLPSPPSVTTPTVPSTPSPPSSTPTVTVPSLK
jgi:hypothetical protein